MFPPSAICNPKGRNQKIKINLENFKFGRNRGEIRSDDLPIKEPGFLPTCLQHFGAGLVYFELHGVNMQGRCLKVYRKPGRGTCNLG